MYKEVKVKVKVIYSELSNKLLNNRISNRQLHIFRCSDTLFSAFGTF